MGITDRPIKNVIIYDEQGDVVNVSPVGALTVTGSMSLVGTGSMLVSSTGSLPVTVQGVVSVSGSFGTQDAAGRQIVVLPARNRVSIVFQAVAPGTVDTLLSLVKSTNGVAAGGSTSIAVAAGKTLRITVMTFSVKSTAAVSAFATYTLRINPSGAAVIGSQSELRVDVPATSAINAAGSAAIIMFPDGFELTGAHQLAVSAAAQATTNILSVTLNGYEY